MLKMSVEQRRTRLMGRHRLGVGQRAGSVAEAVEGVFVLHATDPATVYLSVLSRAPSVKLGDVTAAMYDERSLVKMLAMRRTMFVAPFDQAPLLHSAAGAAIGERLRKRIVKELQTLPTEPQIVGDPGAWLREVEDAVEQVLLARGEALASEVVKAEPRIATALLPTTEKTWDVKANLTSRILTLMGAEGRLVRGRPAGTWISRQHRWMSTRLLWPDGMPELPVDHSRAELAQRWLRAFGPATVADVQWWTGWPLGVTRAALTRVGAVEVDLDGEPGVVLSDDLEADPPGEPSAALLPALDPTPMGWKQREWFLGPHREPLFDRNGNIGPTVWWNGRIVGGWGVRRGGEIAWRLLEDVEIGRANV